MFYYSLKILLQRLMHRVRACLTNSDTCDSLFLKFIFLLRYLVRSQTHGLCWYSKGLICKENVTTEFTVLGSLNMQISKKGGFVTSFW
jgi:hypothetical protein